MYGQPEMIDSPQDPSQVFPVGTVSLGPYSHVGRGLKRYGVLRVPTDPDEVDVICGKAIGKGTTFCTVIGCVSSHRGSRLVLVPGNIHVKISHRRSCGPEIAQRCNYQ